MLIIKAFINDFQIDEIHVQRVGEDVHTLEGHYQYSIRFPEGLEDIPIYHEYKKGWDSLAEHVLATINRAKRLGWIEEREWSYYHEKR